MAEPASLWSVAMGVLGVVAGTAGKSVWDKYWGWKASVPIEIWKIRISQLGRLLSEFYWPLYIRLVRDDVVWTKVFSDLRPQNNSPSVDWVKNMSIENRRKLAAEIESKILIPNHLEAVNIIRTSVHLANADTEFLELLVKYTRHVDTYSSLRSAGIADTDPVNVGEPYPQGFSEAVHARLSNYQNIYDKMVNESGMKNLINNLDVEFENFARYWKN